MDETRYTARLVITEDCEERLDMAITCQNAQQLLRARDNFSDQMNTYIAEFAMQSNLVRMPSNAEQNAAALKAVIQEQTENAKQQEPEEPAEPELPEAAPDEPEESPPPRTMTHSMPSATAQTSHPSNSYPPKLPKRQRHPQEQKA